MQNTSYAIERFHKNISQTSTINEAIAFIKKDAKVDLTIHFESNLPWSLAWDVTSNSLTGSCKITIFPKLVINGELYEASFKHDLVMPPTFSGLEAAFLTTLKDSLGTAQKVWG